MRTDPFRALGRTSAALLAALVLAPVAEAAPKQKRYGIEGEIVRYDEAAKALVVRVLQTKVAGRFASGNTVGGEAPADVRRGAEMSFAVEPEGSVLRRTVIKAMTGGGLDTSGTKQGFKAALAKIPTDARLDHLEAEKSRERMLGQRFGQDYATQKRCLCKWCCDARAAARREPKKKRRRRGAP